MLNPSSFHHTRLALLSRVRLPKEMRLYSKLRLEHAQSSALPSLSALALIGMAEVDLMCEEEEQAGAKIKGARYSKLVFRKMHLG